MDNPWVGKNYIPDTAAAEVPPAFFLARIFDQDAMLVILPSRQKPHAYVIARRKQWGPGLTESAIDAQFTNPDTKMCVMHGCVPVCLMFKTGPTWDIDSIIRTLQARDLWAVGGGDKAADLLEAQDDAAKAEIQAQIRADQWDYSGEGWRSYKARTGASTSRYNDTRKAQPRTGRRIYSNSPSGSMAGSGLVTLD